ncbi:hypothetical protein BpHYR1_012555 [Brachionus plicatilis]|uniref:Uncharacterized protein n=1 Tax=Brachionus plicatilis TaxID=10195 RepID=A0A3M7PIZ9_BRAPC|nr:hypothetical protein BpHYR1_012555 [Brachionus plicatilis]
MLVYLDKSITSEKSCFLTKFEVTLSDISASHLVSSILKAIVLPQNFEFPQTNRFFNAIKKFSGCQRGQRFG